MAENTDDTMEWFWLILIGMFLLPFGVIFGSVRTWLVQHHILVPATDAVVAIKAWNVGLDWPRLLLVVFIFITAIALATAGVRHRRTRALTR